MSLRVDLLPDPSRDPASTGGVTCEQQAEITVDPATFKELWTPSTLELLARLYWRYVERRSRGLIRIEYRPDRQTVILARPRIDLITFRPPEFHTGPDSAWVQWPIDRGLLVARDGRGQGFLRITAGRSPGDPVATERKIVVSSTVSNFYPWVRGSGWFARLGAWIYAQTQLRFHIAITRGFLESLERIPDEVIRQGEDPERRSATNPTPPSPPGS